MRWSSHIGCQIWHHTWLEFLRLGFTQGCLNGPEGYEETDIFHSGNGINSPGPFGNYSCRRRSEYCCTLLGFLDLVCPKLRKRRGKGMRGKLWSHSLGMLRLVFPATVQMFIICVHNLLCLDELWLNVDSWHIISSVWLSVCWDAWSRASSTEACPHSANIGGHQCLQLPVIHILKVL